MTDPADAADAEIRAFLEAERMEATRRYVVRGRGLIDWSEAELAQAFKAAFIAFVARHTDPARRSALEDIEAEFALRGAIAPHDDPDLAPAREAFLDLVKRTHAEMSPEEHARHAETIERDMMAALGRGKVRS